MTLILALGLFFFLASFSGAALGAILLGNYKLKQLSDASEKAIIEVSQAYKAAEGFRTGVPQRPVPPPNRIIREGELPK